MVGAITSESAIKAVEMPVQGPRNVECRLQSGFLARIVMNEQENILHHRLPGSKCTLAKGRDGSRKSVNMRMMGSYHYEWREPPP